MANTTKGPILRSTWDDGDRRWALGGMAASMYTWLEELVAGSAKFHGFELVGTLDPKDPNPANFKSPPKWLSAKLLMEAACVWYAGAMQDYLFSQGLAPLVRARVSTSGALQQLGGAEVEVATRRIEVGSGSAYYILINQDGTSYPLTDRATAVITPSMNLEDMSGSTTVPGVIQTHVRWDKPSDAAAISAGIPASELPFTKWSGWGYMFTDGENYAADIHVFA